MSSVPMTDSPLKGMVNVDGAPLSSEGASVSPPLALIGSNAAHLDVPPNEERSNQWPKTCHTGV